MTVYFALMRRSPIGGLAIGALVGLAQDSLSKNPLGMFGIAKTLVGYIAASVGLQPGRGASAHPPAARILLFTSCISLSFGCWRAALLGQQLGFDTPRTLVLGVLNAVVAVTLFHFLDKLKIRA